MLIFFFIFITVIGMISLVIIGTALLIAALVTKLRAEEKRQPSYYVRRGLIYLAVPVTIAVGFGLYYGYKAVRRASYETVLDMWRDGEGGFGREGDELVRKLIKAVDNGDREVLVKHFSERTKKEQDFDRLIDEFVNNCPDGLSELEITQVKKSSSGEAIKTGGYVSTEYQKYVIKGDGRWYYLSVSFVDYARKADDYIGVCYLRLEDAAARAETNRDREALDVPDISCRLMGYDTNKVRIIKNDAYEWEETGSRRMTVDEARDMFEESGRDSTRMAESLGRPNAIYEYSKGLSIYYYELMPEEGHERYLGLSVNDFDWSGNADVYDDSLLIESFVTVYSVR